MVSLSPFLSHSLFFPLSRVFCRLQPERRKSNVRLLPPSRFVPNSQNNGLSEILELKLHSHRAFPFRGRPCIAVRPLARGRSLNLSSQPQVRAAPCNAGVRRSRASLVKSEALREAFSSSGARGGKPRWIHARVLAANEMRARCKSLLPLFQKNPTGESSNERASWRNCEDTGRSRSWNSAMRPRRGKDVKIDDERA